MPCTCGHFYLVVCIIIAAIVLVVIRKRRNNTQQYPVDDYNMPQTPRLNPLYFANESGSMNGDSRIDDEVYDEIVTSIWSYMQTTAKFAT